jgi:hypothetical protein
MVAKPLSVMAVAVWWSAVLSLWHGFADQWNGDRYN